MQGAALAGPAGRAKPSCSLPAVNKDTACLESSVFLATLREFLQSSVVRIVRWPPNVRFPLLGKVHLRAADVILSY